MDKLYKAETEKKPEGHADQMRLQVCFLKIGHARPLSFLFKSMMMPGLEPQTIALPTEPQLMPKLQVFLEQFEAI